MDAAVLSFYDECLHSDDRSTCAQWLKGGAENASTGKRMYEKRKYGKCKYNANLQSDKKKFGTSQVSVVYFQVGWASGLQIVFFSEIT